MFININYETKVYSRVSKNGTTHTYTRKISIITLRCDNCSLIFTRNRGKMDPKRLSNNYFHVCPNCDSKRFAQRKRVERSQMWDMKASSLENIGKL